ncbi:hypothetical protein RJT34_15389 [Clitoria ternatea]|uniref:Uncharacterized protein n=1 Tax=Clitoria ternatea TaxID=43366 RepID=A0AAN9J5I7_CLITE
MRLTMRVCLLKRETKDEPSQSAVHTFPCHIPTIFISHPINGCSLSVSDNMVLGIGQNTQSFDERNQKNTQKGKKWIYASLVTHYFPNLTLFYLSSCISFYKL